MYLSNYECFNCPQECSSCSDSNHCQSCEEEYVLKENKCIHYTEMEHCQKAAKSHCQKCSVLYKLNDNKNECVLMFGWIIGLPILISVIIIVIVIIILVIILRIIDKKKGYQELSNDNIKILQISKSDIQFTKLNNIIVSNKQILNFNDEYFSFPSFDVI